jgi:tetratricopeptide (TPR) repeat protein
MHRARRIDSTVFVMFFLVGCVGPQAILVPEAPIPPTISAKVDSPVTIAAPASEFPLPAALLAPLKKKLATRVALERKGPRGRTESPEFQPACGAMVDYYKLAFIETETMRDEDKKVFLARIVAEIKGDIDFYESRDFWAIVLRLRYELGRAHVLAGDVEKACREGFDVVVDVTGCRSSDWLDTLMLYAYYKKSKAMFDAGRFDDAVATVNSMFDAIPQALNSNQGNGALLYKAEALILKDPPAYHAACRAATNVVVRANGNWPNNANRLLARILAFAEADKLSIGLSPEIMHGVAVGEVQLAYREVNAVARRRHFEKAIVWLQRTIAATRALDVKLGTRLKHEPAAWFELGIIYSKLDLWYEASFAFEAVTTRFSKARVGRMLAGERRLQQSLADVRRRIASGDVAAEDGYDPPGENELLNDEAAKMPEWSEILKKLDGRRRKSANNLMVAVRRSHQDSRSDFDEERLNRILGVHPNPHKDRGIDFHRGLLARAQAQGYAKKGETREAVERWKKAAGFFLAHTRESESKRTFAYRLRGECLLEAMKATLVLAAKEPGLRSEAKRLGREAYRAFEAFEREAESARSEPDEAATKKLAQRLRSSAEAKAEIKRTFGAPTKE